MENKFIIFDNKQLLNQIVIVLCFFGPVETSQKDLKYSFK